MLLLRELDLARVLQRAFVELGGALCHVPRLRPTRWAGSARRTRRGEARRALSALISASCAARAEASINSPSPAPAPAPAPPRPLARAAA